MAAAYNDGSVPYGSPTLTISTVTYIAESFKTDRPTTKIDRRNGSNEPSGQVLVADFATATATLQKASTSTALPAVGATFDYTDDATVGAETWILTSVGHARAQGDAVKFEITAVKKYN